MCGSTECIGLTAPKLQALVYDILPSTTAVFSYATGSRKLSANKQFFVGAQTVVSLLQTTQIVSDVCFITDHAAYASSDKTMLLVPNKPRGFCGRKAPVNHTFKQARKHGTILILFVLT